MTRRRGLGGWSSGSGGRRWVLGGVLIRMLVGNGDGVSGGFIEVGFFTFFSGFFYFLGSSGCGRL